MKTYYQYHITGGATHVVTSQVYLPFIDCNISAKFNVRKRKLHPFQFLYWTKRDKRESGMKEKIVKASCIDHACKIFLSMDIKKLKRVDYEVKDGKDEFIDISDQPGFENLI